MIQMAVVLFSIPEFIGRFHPVLVHLPIGILLLAALFQLLSVKEKFRSLEAALAMGLTAAAEYFSSGELHDQIPDKTTVSMM